MLAGYPYGNVNKYVPQFRQMVAQAGREHEAGADLALCGGTEDANLLKHYRSLGRFDPPC